MTIVGIYQQFEGVTWYVQKVLNELYDMTACGATCQAEMVEEATRKIVDSFSYVYSETLFRLSEKQKEKLIAITILYVITVLWVKPQSNL